MPSEKDKKFKARTFKVHLTKIRKYLDKDSKVIPVDPKHLGQFEPEIERALIEHADSYIDELMEPQHLRAAPAAKAADERSNPPGPNRTGEGGGIGGGGGGSGGAPPGAAGPLPPIGEEAREPPSGLEREPPPRDSTPQPPPSMVQTYVAGRAASGGLDEEVQQALVGELPTPAADVRDEFCPSCLLYTSPSPRDRTRSRMPSSA